MTIHDAVRALQARSRVSVILIDGRDDSFLMNAAGSNGTYFRSDLSISNYRAADQRVAVGWLASGANNTNQPLVYFNIPANTTVAQDDFVGTSLVSPLTANVVGLRQSADFRANFGVVNLDTASHTWTAKSLFSGVTTQVTVPPYSVVQTTVNSGSAASGGNLAFTLNSNGFGFWWSAYGTSVDNRTGDGWVSRAKQ